MRQFWFYSACLFFAVPVVAQAKPAHLKSLSDWIGPSFAKGLNDCATCHLPPHDEERPHNPFGKRLKTAGDELKKANLPNSLADRLNKISQEDTDGDGVTNLVELVLGTSPGDAKARPKDAELKVVDQTIRRWQTLRPSQNWKPLETVVRPVPPKLEDLKNKAWVKNPVDQFLLAKLEGLGLAPRPDATPETLVRRLYLDLTGLPPTAAQLAEFLADRSPNAYEKLVDKLLDSPQYGEAQARNWLDVWRYSDWAGYGAEIRDSQPHIWRWRDWTIEALNSDKGYDQMIREMLAADELYPTDEKALRATGYVVRNWYKFSREVVLDRLVEHTGKAFLGMTINCARCHDHMYDPISQKDYYAFRAIFSPFDIRTDRVAGQADPLKDGLVRIYDANAAAQTYLFVRGNDAEPDKTAPILPAVPASMKGIEFAIKEVKLPRDAFVPDNREFVVKETRTTLSDAITKEKQALELGKQRVRNAVLRMLIGPTPLNGVWSLDQAQRELPVLQLNIEIAENRLKIFEGQIAIEMLNAKAGVPDYDKQAKEIVRLQRTDAMLVAKKNLLLAENVAHLPAPKGQPDPAKKVADAKAALAKAEDVLKAPLAVNFTPRTLKSYPQTSTGRRTALANWIASEKNPLTARVAVNHLWLRRFGQALVPTVFDFGKNGMTPYHAELMDYLAADLMANGWSLKKLTRTLVTSHAYRMDSGFDESANSIDPDNRFYWRMNNRRMTAEMVRDSILHISGSLDEKMGGVEIDQNSVFTVNRRSIYFRHAPEKQAQFLEIFDAASPVECYKRNESIVPQQALALANSTLSIYNSRKLARSLASKTPDATEFITKSFETLLARKPTKDEAKLCGEFLEERAKIFVEKKLPANNPENYATPSSDPQLRARESLILVLFNHNDFVSIR